MNAEEKALRDAFLAECWAPVREYHQTDGERAEAWSRAQVHPQDVQEGAPDFMPKRTA